EFGGGRFLVGREDDGEAGDDDVEARVFEAERLRIPQLPGDAFGVQLAPRRGQEVLGDVDGGHIGPRPCSPARDLTGTGADLEPALAGRRVEPRHKVVVDWSE